MRHHEIHLKQRDGSSRFQLAPLKKSIYSLQPDLRNLLAQANQRYLDFLADLEYDKFFSVLIRIFSDLPFLFLNIFISC